MTEPEELYSPHDELLTAYPPGQELAAVGMFRWHLRQLIHWSRILRMTRSQLVGDVSRELAGEDPRVRPRRTGRRLPKAQRGRILARDAACKRCGSTQDLQIDHIRAVVNGGSDADSTSRFSAVAATPVKAVNNRWAFLLHRTRRKPGRRAG